jgi:VWFA-related protein
VLIPLCAPVVGAQESAKPATNQDKSAQAIQIQTNLVEVRVVVRDAKGNPVTGLGKTDFELLDNKKPQVISAFSPEGIAAESSVAANSGSGAEKQTPPAADEPQKFTALFFDDYHIAFLDLAQIRDAAKRYLEKSLNAGERVAIFNASGSIHVDFTRDRDNLEQALSRLSYEPRFVPPVLCLNISLPIYMAQKVIDGIDPLALQDAETLVSQCYCPPSARATMRPGNRAPVQTQAQSQAQNGCPGLEFATETDAAMTLQYND